jgi:hypothetical protein
MAQCGAGVEKERTGDTNRDVQPEGVGDKRE